MIDIISGLNSLSPQLIERVGKWLYEFCAARHAELKIGVIVCIGVLYLLAILRERRFFGPSAWILWSVACAYVGQIYLREADLLTGTLLYCFAGIFAFVYCGLKRGEYGLSEIAIGREATAMLMIFIIACASYMRFYRLGEVPGGIINDESLWMRHSLSYMRGEPFDGWVASVAPMMVVLTHSVALFFKLFGVGLIAGRAAMAVTGILGVIALFLMADRLFSRAVALLAASFLATSYCSAGFDRIVVGLNQGILFACLFIYLLLLAEKRGSVLWGLLSGCCLGIGLGAYEPFKSAMIGFFVFIMYRIVFERGYLRKNWAILVMLVVGFLVVSTRLLQQHKAYGMHHGVGQMVFFGNRDHGLNMQSINMFLTDIKLFLRMIFLRMSESIFIINSGPMTNDFLVPLFFVGFICTLYRYKNYAYFLVLAWFVFAPMAGILTWPCARRLTIFFPAVDIMAALGAFLLIKTILSVLRLKGGVFFMVSMVLIVFCLFTVDTYVYFNVAINRTFEHHKEVTEYANRQIGVNYMYFVDFDECMKAVDVVTYDRRRGEDPRKFYSFIKGRDVHAKIFNTPPHDMIFVILNQNTKTIGDIVDRFAFARVEKGKHMSWVKILGSDLLKERGAEVSYEPGSDDGRLVQRMAAKTMAAEFDWESCPLAYPFRVEIEGFFYVPEDGKYDFQATGDADTEVYVDGDRIAVLPPSGCDLKGGGHSIRVVHKQNAPGKFGLMLGRPGAPAEPIYLWGGLLQKMYGLKLPPTQTPTITPTPTDTPTPPPTMTPTPSGIWRIFWGKR